MRNTRLIPELRDDPNSDGYLTLTSVIWRGRLTATSALVGPRLGIPALPRLILLLILIVNRDHCLCGRFGDAGCFGCGVGLGDESRGRVESRRQYTVTVHKFIVGPFMQLPDS